MFALAIFIFGLVKSFIIFRTEYIGVPSACMISVSADETSVYLDIFESQPKLLYSKQLLFCSIYFLLFLVLIKNGKYFT